MANSKKPANKHAYLLSQVQQFLAEVFANQKYLNPSLLVAFSGGLDSSVLLHMLAKLRSKLSIELSAMHVHHGLSANADAWAAFCENSCRDLDIPFQLKKVYVDQKSGLGTEAAARNVRYDALYKARSDFICLAQHQNDQAETLLLQLARGAGVKGLAGMASVSFERKILRPLLNFSRSELEAYAKIHQLQWIEDESNDDTQYDRNFIRHEVFPGLQKRYPAITKTLSRTAENLGAASSLLDDLAEIDAGDAVQKDAILLDIFNNLNVPRRANLMRWWLAKNQVLMPNTHHLQQIIQQFFHAKLDATIKIKVDENQYLRSYQGSIYLVSDSANAIPISLLWQGEPEITLADNSRLTFQQKLGVGLVLPQGSKLRIKSREGGERFRPEIGRPSRTLKFLLQASAMPPWQREQLPLIFMGETLAYIPNIGAAAELQAKPGEKGYVISWMVGEK